jgi:hypothetical protein
MGEYWFDLPVTIAKNSCLIEYYSRKYFLKLGLTKTSKIACRVKLR